jgi:hypothetical protein
MKSLLSIGLALLLPLTSTAVLAQKFTPGLWENSMTMKSGGGEMDAQMAQMKEEMAKMPPEQRKMMEDMMAKQGVSVGAAGKSVTVKACITPEMASRDEMPQEGNCKQTSKERSGNTVRIKFACTGKEPSSGESEYTMVSDKQHKGRTVVNSIANGKPQRMEMEHSGKWIAADCGELKPRK